MSPLETEPVFAEPWEARAFALTVHLHERGLFSWNDWSQRLGNERARRPDEGYYRSWTRALETLLGEVGIAEEGAIDGLTAAWHEAARVTPHGAPIELEKTVERLAAGERPVSSSGRN